MDVIRTTPLPASGAIFLDQRGEGRALRVAWHPESGTLVLSLWREGTCAATHRLAVEDIPAFVEAIVTGIAAEVARRIRLPRWLQERHIG
jgi:hypothetical protein